MPSDRIPLLLLPGLLCDAALYAPQLEGLADVADMRVADLSRHDTMAALGADALVQAPWPRFAVAGLSMGGYAAHEVMRQGEGRILGLALLDTSARPDSEEATANRRRLMSLAQRDFPAVVETLLPKLMNAKHVADPRLAAVVRGMAGRIGAEAFARQERAIIGRADSRPHLAHIGCPTLVLTGADDALITREMHEEQAAAIRGAELVVVPGCGHLSTIEAPPGVNAALRAWLARVGADAR